jgi:hypothetical protein
VSERDAANAPENFNRLLVRLFGRVFDQRGWLILLPPQKRPDAIPVQFHGKAEGGNTRDGALQQQTAGTRIQVGLRRQGQAAEQEKRAAPSPGTARFSARLSARHDDDTTSKLL